MNKNKNVFNSSLITKSYPKLGKYVWVVLNFDTHNTQNTMEATVVGKHLTFHLQNTVYYT